MLHIFQKMEIVNHEPNTRKKNASNNKLSQKNKKSLENVTGKGFEILKWKRIISLNIKNADTLVGQTKTKPQEPLEFKLKQQMKTFSFSTPIDLSEESKVISCNFFAATNSVSNKTDGNTSFSINMQGHWNSKSGENTFDDLSKLLELRSQSDNKLHVGQVRWKG